MPELPEDELGFHAALPPPTRVSAFKDPEEVPSAADKRLVLTAWDLAAALPGFSPDSSLENWRAYRLATSREVDHWGYEYRILYEYMDRARSVLLHSAFAVAGQVHADQAMYHEVAKVPRGHAVLHLQDLFGTKDLHIAERGDLWQWGDESACFVVLGGERRVGNLFVARQGRFLLLVVIGGLSFDAPGPVQTTLEPLVDRIQQHIGSHRERAAPSS